MRAVLLPLVLSLSACGGARPCVEACEDGQEFWEACFDVLVDDHAIVPACYDDPEAMGERLGEAGDDEERRQAVYEEAWDGGEAHDCEDADEVVEDCTARVTGEFRTMERDDKDERLEECRGEADTSALDEAMADLDCDAFVEALGI